ncbi:NADP-dependent isocitrate dehydrogenase [Candidatus Profftella armatura]|uniref:isocitrate dehydrogenase (NADP(+)) n=1 Tax=Candidatus Profftella armatura TaxID=669502 RepID=S5R118_9PROT|nr:NADP-dependent isocitrate dehydrogenase [Candidatus Profftella armatura]AGS06882.1 isocitrate dehydrogenase, NADP-dependent [Candidatus Profftella armatura]ALC95966.1 isocitrate dehydrogenase [Candidatus Profftella armatura]
MTINKSTIFYTLTDEAPMLATYSFFPIIKKFTTLANIKIISSNISIAARTLSKFSSYLRKDQKILDDLDELSKLIKKPYINIIKLPNISASLPQLINVISELQLHGYKIPNFPENPKTEKEKLIKIKYSQLLGSVVNPILREGNSDRRIPVFIKNHARKNPYYIKKWSSTSKTHVSYMTKGDFYDNEKSITLNKSCNIRMELLCHNKKILILNKKIPLLKDEILDSSFLSKELLCDFYENQIKHAYENNLLLSLHLKCTMMKKSDPIIFGYAIKTFYKNVFIKHKKIFKKLNINVNNGLSNLLNKIKILPKNKYEEIIYDIKKCDINRPSFAMVDIKKGISNLHAPNYIIIDSSMPTMIRNGGKMLDKIGNEKETKAIIPDSTFAKIYQEIINFCKKNNLDPSIMGTVQNIGLMAQKSEEYGSHDKTFEIPYDGIARIVDVYNNNILIEHHVKKGDIWRVCQTKDESIKNWIMLAINRSKQTNIPTIFWLDTQRPHEFEIIKKIEFFLKECNVKDIKNIKIMSKIDAMNYTLKRLINGKDTISVTGNVLRDYLTDLFPILELGTSSKMLSIIPLLSGGNLFETGSGGSAPKHIEQFLIENHLRWNSLGEFLALLSSLECLFIKTNNKKANILSKTLEIAINKLLDYNKLPSPIVNELDTRESQFYLTIYWAQALATQKLDKDLNYFFTPFFNSLLNNQKKIIKEFQYIQGKPVNIGGYFMPINKLINHAMRPSKTFNKLLNLI